MASSLEELCSSVVVVSICTIPDVKKLIFDRAFKPLHFFPEFEDWKHLFQERILTENCISLPPGLLKIIPKYLITFVGIQMLKWGQFMELKFGLTLEYIQNFLRSSFFTPKGKINEIMAAIELVKDSGLSVFVRYKISCYYYLTDFIPVLRQKCYDNELKY